MGQLDSNVQSPTVAVCSTWMSLWNTPLAQPPKTNSRGVALQVDI
jgi:hypothetical protein